MNVSTSDASVNEIRGMTANGPSNGEAFPVQSNDQGVDDTSTSKDKSNSAARCPQHRPGTVLNPVAFDRLANSSEELWIELEGQLYRLRKTKQGKLILTK